MAAVGVVAVRRRPGAAARPAPDEGGRRRAARWSRGRVRGRARRWRAARGARSRPGCVYLRAAAVAGMVGGLADWFAVTALFRHPLGLPDPAHGDHPDPQGRHRAQPGRVRRDVLPGRGRGPRRGSRRVGRPARVGALAGRSRARRAGHRRARDRGLRAGLSRAAGRRRPGRARADRRPQAGRGAGRPALGRLLAGVVADGVAPRAGRPRRSRTRHRWLVENQDAVVDAVARQAPAWSPRFVDERVAERVHAEVLRVAIEVRDDPRAPAACSRWTAFLASYAAGPAARPRDPAAARRRPRRRCSRTRRSARRSPTRRRPVRTMVLEAVDDPTASCACGSTEAVARVRLPAGRPTPELQAKVDGWLEDLAAHVASELPRRAHDADHRHRRAVGRAGDRAPHRAAGRSRPAVHPHQRDRRRGTRRDCVIEAFDACRALMRPGSLWSCVTMPAASVRRLESPGRPLARRVTVP